MRAQTSLVGNPADDAKAQFSQIIGQRAPWPRPVGRNRLPSAGESVFAIKAASTEASPSASITWLKPAALAQEAVAEPTAKTGLS